MNVQPFPSQSNPTAEANGTVVTNMLTLEVAVEDINTPGESAGLKTAHTTLVEKTGWPLACCFGGAVQKGKVSCRLRDHSRDAPRIPNRHGRGLRW